MITISTQYFAILREQRGLAHETIQTAAPTPGSLYSELRERHHFTLPLDRIRAAINGEFVPSDAPLADGDEVVFIPPVAGG
ncbi:MAG: MoaD/ThiS family protein [Opitutus sp.]